MSATKIGYIMLTVGFLLAAYMSVLDRLEVDFAKFGPAALIAIVGVVVARRATRKAATKEETVAGNINDIETSLAAIVEKVGKINAEKDDIFVYDLPKTIDSMLLDDLDTFVNARETIGVKYGLNAYAEIMSHYAAGERYLNRVWSCSADGYVDEAHTYIGRAFEQFNDTNQLFQKLKAGGAIA